MARARKGSTTIDAGTHPVITGPGALEALQRWLAHDERGNARFVLCDTNTLRCCLPELLHHVPALADTPTVEVPPGEASKQLAVCERIWETLAMHEADRDTVLIALGGGVISDLAGFAAGAYKRGIRCVHVPTTLMGMVDAAIGGKSAVDLGGVKNIVGMYHDPVAVHVHTPFLRTLGKRELVNGVAEMLKHGLIADAAHWNSLREAPLHDLDALAPLIERSIAIKAAIVKEDPREDHGRKALNFGHTIGHAVEALSWESPQRALLHGEAVAIGMAMEAWIAWKSGRLNRGDFTAIEEHLIGLFPRFLFSDDSHHRLITLIRNDKKRRDERMLFTLLHGIGDAAIDVAVAAAQVKDAVAHYRARMAGEAIDDRPQERWNG